MDLIESFLEGKTEFSCYDDFYKNFHLKLPEHFNFATDVVDYYATNQPDKTALVWCNDEGEERIFTFSQISEESLKAAAFLSGCGIKAGDVVMLLLHRRFEYWFFVLALHRLGAVALPVPSQLLKDDLEYRIKAAGVKLVVACSQDDCVNQLEMAVGESATLVSVDFKKDGWIKYSAPATATITEAAATVTPASPMLMYFTSGTSSAPKMVVHNYYYPLSHIITAKYWQCVVPDGLHFTIAETGWAKASWGKLYGQWLVGSAVFVYDRQNFNPERILEKISKYKVTTFCANPTVYRYLINQTVNFDSYDLSSLKHCCSAGESLPQDVSDGFYKKTGLRIYEGYGQSETALLTANFCFDPAENSMGKPSPLYDLHIIDEAGKECSEGQAGEVVLNLKHGQPVGLFSEYFDDKVLTAAAFKGESYHTGDIAVREKDGRLYFKGRRDDIIKSSGFRISPFEVESVLCRHPAVLECAVTGEKDETRGQIVTAIVVPAQGYEPSVNLEHELISFMHKKTALYKCPRKIVFVKELPKTYNGKTIRNKGIKNNSGNENDD